MNKNALGILIALTVLIFGIVFNYSAPAKYKGQSVDIKNLDGYALVYTSNTGVLPPEYYRENVLTIRQAGGIVTGEHAVKDYKEVLEKKPVSVTDDLFRELVLKALQLSLSSESGDCTGGTMKSLGISKDGVLVRDFSAYACAGQSTNPGLEALSLELEKLFQ